ncbi:UNVERIFIED_CONTAM: Retrovirus-related Pol polyprotein from type-2 retrotransposable element R2DM [Sesamum latifolium]|uniref:Retrovirus-related Pol polyprotein from type-2 retrotransposable element R2DM n=1 Tax=Sesamum latifolium TaxID=2727402 RepID=A0AAW2UY90_9LAMI
MHRPFQRLCTDHSRDGGRPIILTLLQGDVFLSFGIRPLSTFTPKISRHKSSTAEAKEADLALQEAQTQLESDPENVAIWGSLGDLRGKAVFLAEAERQFYYQKAKVHFLKMGDRNTKFFHDIVKRNVARSSILAITKSDSTVVTSAADIGHEFVAYYTSLLGTEVQTLQVDNDVFEWGPKLSSEHALELCRAVTLLEVKEAIFHISDNKAPGPDGFSACFFKIAWNVVGDQVCTAVLDFFRSGRMLRQLNHAIIALVPKSEHCPSVTDYQPISCCNVVYKAITKIIADRLAPKLEHLIDRCQAAFVRGRNITYNIFLAQKMVRRYTMKQISPHCTINVDLRKAFDSISWDFLSQVLHGYGFPTSLYFMDNGMCFHYLIFSGFEWFPSRVFSGQERTETR